MNIRQFLAAVATTAFLGVTAGAQSVPPAPTILTFRPIDSPDVAIHPTQMVPVQGSVLGALVGKFAFQSNIVQNGKYVAKRMVAFWRLKDSLAHTIHANELTAGSEWNGVLPANSVLVESLNPTTGEGVASFMLPVGGVAGMGGIRYPQLPDLTTTLTIVYGWSGTLALSQAGSPTGVLGSVEKQFDTAWPDLWVGRATPQGFAQFQDSSAAYSLMLKAPSTSPRTFTITAQPPGIVTVLDSPVTMPAGEVLSAVHIRGDRLGSFHLEVTEGGGSPIAQSSADSIVMPFVFGVVDGGAPVSFTESGIEPAIREWDWSFLGGSKKCNSECVGGGPREPTKEFCFPCKVTPNPEPSCPAEEPGYVAYWLIDASCDEGDTTVTVRRNSPGQRLTAGGRAVRRGAWRRVARGRWRGGLRPRAPSVASSRRA